MARHRKGSNVCSVKPLRHRAPPPGWRRRRATSTVAETSSSRRVRVRTDAVRIAPRVQIPPLPPSTSRNVGERRSSNGDELSTNRTSESFHRDTPSTVNSNARSASLLLRVPNRTGRPDPRRSTPHLPPARRPGVLGFKTYSPVTPLTAWFLPVCKLVSRPRLCWAYASFCWIGFESGRVR